MIRKNTVFAVLVTFCLTAMLFMIVPVSSYGTYDPWIDFNDDGKIDVKDIATVAKNFGSNGTPINKTALLLELQSKIDSLNSSLLNLEAYLETRIANQDALIAELQAQIDSLNASLTDLINQTRNIYEVEIKAYCPIGNHDVTVDIAKNGIPSGFNTTCNFTLIGDNAFTVPLSGPENHTFTHWSTGSTNNTITVTSAGEYIAYYQRETGVLFFDDFNDGNANGWTANSGSWSVISGEYFVTVGVTENGISTVDGANLTDCTIDIQLRFTDSVGFHAGIIFRYTDNEHYYSFEIGNEYDSMRIVEYSPADPNYGESMAVVQPSLGNSSIIINSGTEYNLKIVVQGNTFTAYLDGQQVLSCTDQTYANGAFGLRARRADVYFDNFNVTGLP